MTKELMFRQADLPGETHHRPQEGAGKEGTSRNARLTEAVRARVESLLEKYRVQDLFIWSVRGEGRSMELHFEKDTAVVKRLRQLDGVYTLLATLPDSYTIDTLLECWKCQYLSENRFRDLKGPLALRPVHLKNNRRIVSIVFIVYVALMCYCLLDRTVRNHLGMNGMTLYDRSLSRRLTAPTGRWLLSAFEFWFVILRHSGEHTEYIAQPPTELQMNILRCLGIDEPLAFLTG
ncbi:MAG: hypothetical protein ACOYEP_10885 [Limnochordia bacterium]|jgi:transposase